MAGEHDPIEPAPAPAAPDAQQAMDRLNEQNRILTETRMLPRSKPLTAKQTADVVAFFNSYVERTKTTQVLQVSREIGYSQAVVSAWMAGNYKGDSDKVTHAINDWMERDSRRQMAKRPQDYISTRIAESIRTLVSAADKLMSESGSSK